MLFGSTRVVTGVLGAALIMIAPASWAAGALRIAVAPFAGEQAGNPVSVSLAKHLDRHALERLLAPGSFVAEARFDPSAEEVRRWAYNAAVENVVVGRVVAGQSEGTPFGGQDRGARAPADSAESVEVSVRSGHSGAELSNYTVAVPSAGGFDAAAGTLALAILEDLGYTAPVDPAAGDPGATSLYAVGEGARPGTRREEAGSESGRGLEAGLELPGFRNDAPIEIKAEEAEIVNRGKARKLIFQRNVFVRQSNVVLRSDRLEASYRKGDSEPERLDATGKVFVDQAGRHAKCDRAIYLRDAQTLTCTGHAELVQGCDVVRGESIEFDLAEDRARVQGAASIVIRPEGSPGAVCAPVGSVL